MDLQKLLPQVRAAVIESGALIREAWDKPRKVRYKGRIDLVTETDVAVEHDLKARLAKILPVASFLAEESEADAPLSDLTWIIDPIDGTTNFTHQVPFVCTSVGLWHKDRIVLGVINAPIMNECFYAASGLGAWCNDKRIFVTRNDKIEHSLVATGFPYTVSEEADEVTDRLRRVLKAAQGVRRLGAAALDLAYLAAGRFDVFYEKGLKPWDVAAGWLIVNEAGGWVTEYDASKDFSLYSPNILASNTLLHAQMTKLM
ncbi:inositol monophosphatase family protein [Halodesulfovibrio marinisediminis]|uniref:Inositol-1-monophosphatase n=1 Tax=Halodesulfovibrio marinisediminis DSM 17456 TaxID=1121457 RepID=A0A1N6E274_9BACT|nr:inositol monophosphatase family protein [Halodesulfovibrio marinisediminis]SIN77119.1 myo-inositol-1(or 4)-monophosphatase [Halodesulfovibrio marinisediminis DSM 17456]